MQARVLELTQHPDVGERTGPATGEDEAQGPAGQPVGEGAQPHCEVAVDDRQLSGVGGRDPGRPELVRRRRSDEDELGLAGGRELEGHPGHG